MGAVKEAAEIALSTLFTGGKKSFGSAGEEFLSKLSPQDTFNLKQLHKLDFEKGTHRFDDFGESVRQGIDQNIPERAGDVHATLIEIEDQFKNQRHLDTQAKQGTELKNQKGYDPQTELDGLEEKYIQASDQSDWNKILEDGWAEDESIQLIYAEYQRAKKRGSASGMEGARRKIRQLQGTPGKHVEQAGKEFAQSRADMADRLVKRDAYGVHRKTDPEFPGQKPLSKPETTALKNTEGLEALIEQHHMMSAYDSSELAVQLGKLGKKFKYNAYMYMLNQYKMLPGDFDLNIANIPTGPHRLKSGNLHAWLNDMGFEEYWRAFAKANPGNPDPNLLMQAIDRYFDEVFYPALIKMDALVQSTPQKYQWKGLYIAPYLLKDARARVKHLNETMYPQNLRSTAGGKDVAIDQLHTMASQGGEDLPGYRGMEVVDGQMIKAREGFGGPGIGDLTSKKAYKALNTPPTKKKAKSK